MLRLLGLAILLVFAWWAFLFTVQRGLLFPRPDPAGVPPRPADAQVVWLDTPASRTEAWLLRPHGDSTAPAPVLLFAHGNAELIDFWPPEFDEPRAWGMAVLLVEYPGYGRSKGAPTEASIAAAMAAAFDWVATQPALDASRIVAYGRSLGGGAIGTLVPARKPAALVFESTFTTTRVFARSYGAPEFLVRDPFDNLAAVRQFGGPMLVLHGDHDEVIPVSHGEALARAAKVELHRMPCGHNDCARVWPELRRFLSRHGILASP